MISGKGRTRRAIALADVSSARATKKVFETSEGEGESLIFLHGGGGCGARTFCDNGRVLFEDGGTLLADCERSTMKRA